MNDQIKRWARNRRVRRKIRHISGEAINPCLDAACGGFPIPIADFAVDLERTPFDLPEMRTRLAGRFVMADIVHLPFADKSFAFVHCSNALEHMEYPQVALEELQRIGLHGFVETPTWFFDAILLTSPEHRWIVGWKDAEMVLSRPKIRRIFGFQVLPFSIFAWFRKVYRPLWKVIMTILDIFGVAFSSTKW